MYNKYLRQLGIKPHYDFRVSPHRIKNGIKHIYQRLTCGGHCSKDCWGLDTYNIEQLYTLLNIYLEDANGFIVLDDPMIRFEWEGRTISQLDAIIYIIASLGGYLQFIDTCSSDFDLEAEWYKQAQKGLQLYSIIVHSMWW